MMYDDDWDEAEEDWESDEFDDDESDDSSELDTMPCPYCGESMFDDAPSCPHCGNYITEEDLPPSAKPGWFVLAAWLCLLGASTWFYFLWQQ